MDLQFSGEVWFWRGPAPHHFEREQVDLGDTVSVGLTIDL